MSFLSNIGSFGVVETTRSYSYSKHLDPVQRRQMNFIQNAKRQAEDVKSGKDLAPNAWVAKKTEGGKVRYKVSLRVGPKLIQLPGGTHVTIETKERVIEFLEGVIAACENGELDDLLAKTAGKEKIVEESEPQEDSPMMSS